MQTLPLQTLLRRLALPVGLAIACAAVWIIASSIGDLSVEQASPVADDAVAPLSIPIASVRRVPGVAAEALTDERRALALDGLPESISPLSCVVIMVDDEVVYEVRGTAELLPAYTQLLVTGHTALEVLGPEFTYTTQAMVEQLPDDDGSLIGNLYLVGSGDPVLMSYSYARSFRPILSTRTSIEDLADAAVERGLLRLGGSVVGVDLRYDDQRFLPGWPAEYSESGLIGPASALQLDDGFAERAAANGGVAIIADEPAAHAAERFDDLLEASDVRIDGLARTLFPDEELPSLIPLATVESAPLADIVFQMLAVNDASAAELMLKEVGFDFRRVGTTQAGADAVSFVSSDLGVNLAVAPRDASGLDPVSTSSCRSLAAFAAAIPDDHPTLAVMPAHDLPGVYGGSFTDLTLTADLRLVGGQVGDAAGLVARTIDDGSEIVIASLVNRSGGTLPLDVAFHRRLVQSVDGLRLAWVEAGLEG